MLWPARCQIHIHIAWQAARHMRQHLPERQQRPPDPKLTLTTSAAPTCAVCTQPVRQLQLLYQSRFKEELQEQAAARAASGATAGPRPADPDFSRPVFLGAAFFLVAKLRKVCRWAQCNGHAGCMYPVSGRLCVGSWTLKTCDMHWNSSRTLMAAGAHETGHMCLSLSHSRPKVWHRHPHMPSTPCCAPPPAGEG